MITGEKDEWITIADGRPNLNGRTYTEVALDHIHRTAFGKPVGADGPENPLFARSMTYWLKCGRAWIRSLERSPESRRMDDSVRFR